MQGHHWSSGAPLVKWCFALACLPLVKWHIRWSSGHEHDNGSSAGQAGMLHGGFAQRMDMNLHGNQTLARFAHGLKFKSSVCFFQQLFEEAFGAPFGLWPRKSWP